MSMLGRQPSVKLSKHALCSIKHEEHNATWKGGVYLVHYPLATVLHRMGCQYLHQWQMGECQIQTPLAGG